MTHTGHRGHRLAHERTLGRSDHLVHHGSGDRGGLSEQVGAAEHLGRGALTDRLLAGVVAHRLGSQHQAREVELPLVQLGDVRAVDVAQLALETLVDDTVLLGGREAPGVLVIVGVDHLEQGRERGAEFEAQATAVTQVVDPCQFIADVCLVEILGMLRVVGSGHDSLGCCVGIGYGQVGHAPTPLSRAGANLRSDQSASRPCWKRPAWLFSARASVSNHSAISSKPSSRAVLEKPGYIWVYS